MNINSNLYTFGFASIMVIVVAALLSITALSLQDRQDRNVELEKKQNILNSVKESFSSIKVEILLTCLPLIFASI